LQKSSVPCLSISALEKKGKSELVRVVIMAHKLSTIPGAINSTSAEHIAASVSIRLPLYRIIFPAVISSAKARGLLQLSVKGSKRPNSGGKGKLICISSRLSGIES